MNLIHLVFWGLSALAIVAAMGVVFTKNPVYSILSLIACFFAIAGHYVLLSASFLAVVHIIVYAGAIMVLFLFVLMLLNLNAETEAQKPFFKQLIAVLSAGMLLLSLVAVTKKATLHTLPTLQKTGSAEALGKLLFSTYLIPFELTSVLFLAALVGVVMIGKQGDSK
ncbi:MAG: NADH-quinone oxidoreductase subunit J [Candidatus Margulisiibacteriota bacterium]